jgi:antitoxin (DNA-binding transcriptional repressor) of toxin-antitoxin stability system
LWSQRDHKEGAMKRVGIREFRDHATQYLASDEVLAIERHGRPIGLYIPAAASKQESFAQALERLQQTVQQVVAETGLTEEELSRLYDLNEPVPDEPRMQHRRDASDEHAPGR